MTQQFGKFPYRLVPSLVAASLLTAAATTRLRAAPTPDFSRYVAMGDGWTAGFQDGALHAASQQRSYPALLAASFDVQFTAPLLAEPGFPAPNTITGQGLLLPLAGRCGYGEVGNASGASSGRIDQHATPANLAVPWQTIADAINRQWSITAGTTPDSFEDFVLGYPAVLEGSPPASQLDTAAALDPTFVTIWLGNYDVQRAALAATVSDATLTPPPTFAMDVDTVVDRLAATGALGVVLTVPDPSIAPALLSAHDVKQITGLSYKKLKKKLGVTKTSWVPLSVLPTLQAIRDGQAHGPLRDNQVLTGPELEAIRDATLRYNRGLVEAAERHGWLVVDAATLFAEYDESGVSVGPYELTTAYRGGLFGLDGLSLSNTAQALVAAEIIKGLSARYGLSLGYPDVVGIAAADTSRCQ